MSIELLSTWTQDSYFSQPNLESRGNPTSMTPGVGNQYRRSAVDTYGVFDIAQNQMTKPDPVSVVTLKNTRYKGMSQAASNKKLMQSARLHRSVAKLNRNSVFSKPNDGETENAAAYAALEIENPDFILDRANDKEIEDALADENSIAKGWMTDTGTGQFNYDAPEADNVKMVIDSNDSYLARRDRFFIKPQEGIAAEKQLRLAEMQEASYQAALSASLSRIQASGGKDTRRRR